MSRIYPKIKMFCIINHLKGITYIFVYLCANNNIIIYIPCTIIIKITQVIKLNF